MSRGSIQFERHQAEARIAVLACRQRMSIELLADAFRACGGAMGITGAPDKPESIIIGPTFSDTVALNRNFLDIYEEEPKVRRIA